MIDLRSSIEDAFLKAEAQQVFSGAALLVANGEEILYENTFGRTRIGGAAVSPDSRFDLASITKALSTALVCMAAVTRGALTLETPLGRCFPESLLPSAKRDIRILHLLNHCSGFPPYSPLFKELMVLPTHARKQQLLHALLTTPLTCRPGTSAQYSDLGFMLLGFLLEQILGSPLEELFRRTAKSLVSDVSMDASGSQHPPARRIDAEQAEEDSKPVPAYVPLDPGSDPTVRPIAANLGQASYVATELCPWRRRLIQGEVHDENAYALGGVAAHAGLFGTAREIHSLLSALWKTYEGQLSSEVLDRDILRLFWTRPGLVPGSTWALGFDTPSPQDSTAGRYFSPRSVGHLGFTGTSFWLDLERGRLIILLTNRVHPSRDNERLKLFRPFIHDLITEKLP